MDDSTLAEPSSSAQPTEQAKLTLHDGSTFDLYSRPYLLPARLWFASTAIPLIAGTFGPIANAFSICALSQPWRSEIEEVGPGPVRSVTVMDPAWFLAVNSVSLALALISNVALLLNMTRRLSISIALPITVGGWYLASILLVILTAVFPRTVDMRSYQLTQGYYYGIVAAAIYFLISSLMMITVYAAMTDNHYPKEFELTRSQRTMMLQTILYMCYLLLGALVYSYVEDWAYLDALYWANFTIMTTGIGDLAPQTNVGRGLLFPFAVGGVLSLALIIASIRSMMLDRGKTKLTARTTEKMRQKVADSIRQDRGFRFWSALLRIQPHDPEASENDKQRQEFMLMRSIHHAAGWQLRWFSLLTSLLAWTGLWLLGALAFSISERPQGWSFFNAVYFAYTSLLTIGYGDVAPGRTWGKPFFVIWSLLAVPTMTILFSSFGDTITRLFNDVTTFAGELTLLPGDATILDRLRSGITSIATGIRHPWHESFADETEGWTGSHDLPSDPEKRPRVEHDERQFIAAAAAAASLPPSRRQYILIREIRKLQQDRNANPTKQYSYDEWRFYLSLVGIADSCTSYARIAPTQRARNDGVLTIGLRAVSPSGMPSRRRWSWIGMRSPLMGDKEEAEWLLEMLSYTLERELKQQCEGNGDRNC